MIPFCTRRSWICVHAWTIFNHELFCRIRYRSCSYIFFFELFHWFRFVYAGLMRLSDSAHNNITSRPTLVYIFIIACSRFVPSVQATSACNHDFNLCYSYLDVFFSIRFRLILCLFSLLLSLPLFLSSSRSIKMCLVVFINKSLCQTCKNSQGLHC